MIVFEISRMAFHNGPGIRTMVHFKGCPLKCAWCSTPESQSPKPQIALLRGKCIGCGMCAAKCPQACLHIAEDGQIAVDWKNCTNCLACADVCCTRAFSVVGTDYSAEELYREIKKDEVLFRRSKGGVTFSGGEVLMQVTDEMLRLFRMLKEDGISMGFDTAGFVNPDHLAAVIPYADFFLWDIKALDPGIHQKYVGSGTELIRKNLFFADEQGIDLYLRCPIIPGVNDNPQHFEELIRLAEKLHHIREIHLLPLHHIGSSRYTKIGLTDPYQDVETVSREYLEEREEQLEKAGFHTRIIG